jgi:hypothetical protein
MPIIQTKYSTTTTTPTNGTLLQGEITHATQSPRMHVGNASGNPVVVIGTLANQATNAVAITGGAINNTTITATSLNTTSLTVGSSTALTSVDNSSSTLGLAASVLPTQNAVKTYVDTFGTNVLANVYSYTSNSTYSPSSSQINRVKVICVAGGGGAAGHHESGGAGGYSEGYFLISGISTPVTITVGGGGNGGGYYGNYGAGGTTSFGPYLSATGGYGANNNNTHSGGHGGYGYGGQIQAPGGGGAGHLTSQNNGAGGGGVGGASWFGGPNPSCHSTWTITPPAAFGSGGGGGNQTTYGQNGKGGICIVYEFK